MKEGGEVCVCRREMVYINHTMSGIWLDTSNTTHNSKGVGDTSALYPGDQKRAADCSKHASVHLFSDTSHCTQVSLPKTDPFRLSAIARERKSVDLLPRQVRVLTLLNLRGEEMRGITSEQRGQKIGQIRTEMLCSRFTDD